MTFVELSNFFVSDFRAASNADPAAALPDRLHLDQLDPDAAAGRPAQVDLLGPVPELLTAPSDHHLHHRASLLGWAGQRSK